MPPTHTVFCKAAAAVKRLQRSGRNYSDPLVNDVIVAIVAQQACLEAINTRLHKLEDRAHQFDPNRVLG